MHAAALLVAVLVVSWAAILVRVADAPPLAIAFWRLALGSLLVSPLILLARRPPATPRPVRRSGWLVLSGVALAAHFAGWIAALQLTTVASAAILAAMAPIFAALLSGPLLGERPTSRTWLAALLGAAGAAVIAAGDLGSEGHALAGDLLALMAAAAGALYLTAGRKLRSGAPLPVYLLQVNGIGAAVVLLASLGAGSRVAGFSGSTWTALLALAAGPHLAGHGLLNLSVRHFSATTVNLALMGEPVLATLYAVFLFAEWPPVLFYAGAALVVAALSLELLAPRLRGVRG